MTIQMDCYLGYSLCTAIHFLYSVPVGIGHQVHAQFVLVRPEAVRRNVVPIRIVVIVRQALRHL